MPSRHPLTQEEVEEIINYYLFPHTGRETQVKFNISQAKLYSILNKNNINKHDKNLSLKLAQDKAKCTNLEKYSVEFSGGLPEFVDKAKKTCLDKYGVEHSTQSSEIKNKIKQTNLEKYGGLAPACNQIILNKMQQTNLERYGSKSPYGDKKIQKKATQTSLSRYGVEHFTNQAQAKETCLKKYGTEYVFQAESVKNKIKQTNLEKYGYSYPIQNQDIMLKSNQTKLVNKSFSSSKPEELFYEFLLQKYPDVKRQYSDNRYPFNCDFYIPSIDLFVELNLSWTHGKHPFDTNSTTDNALLAAWKLKAKTSKYYEAAIETWTIRDQKKLKIAKQCRLNYITIYQEDYDRLIKGEIEWQY